MDKGSTTYRGWRAGRSGPLKAFKIVDGEGFARRTILDPAPSQKLWDHSPDGFQWGYGGSGPSQLALALLLDATDDPETSVRLHQGFKARFVAGWGDQWEISKSEILQWVNTRPVAAGAGEYEDS